MANRAALEAAINAVLTTKTTNDWVEVLESARECGCAMSRQSSASIMPRSLAGWGSARRSSGNYAL
jgi:crotonobetainyl-CoA:carnitine CoA-transferase CaiB-like acyl-CoA transferase